MQCSRPDFNPPFGPYIPKNITDSVWGSFPCPLISDSYWLVEAPAQKGVRVREEYFKPHCAKAACDTMCIRGSTWLSTPASGQQWELAVLRMIIWWNQTGEKQKQMHKLYGELVGQGNSRIPETAADEFTIKKHTKGRLAAMLAQPLSPLLLH